MNLLQTSFIFWIYRSKITSKGESPLYMRITVGNTRTEIATGINLKSEYWNHKKQEVSNQHLLRESINLRLSALKMRFNAILSHLIESKIDYTAETIKVRMVKDENNIARTLLEAISIHNKNMKELVGKDYSISTLKRYKTLENLLIAFLQNKYELNDFILSHLSVKFLLDFEHYLKVDRNCNHNTTAKYLKNLKKIINTAIVNEWLVKNPFLGHKIKIKPTQKDYLTETELGLIENKVFSMDRLENIRKIFLFQCYTGLAYVDIKNLKPENLVKLNNRNWIIIAREKTQVQVKIPLIKKAEVIIKQHLPFPVPSNQKMNAYLKEIADLCGINKEISSHTARRTFATLSLTKGVSIESVSSLLGHTSIKTTQIYAKITNEKLLSEIRHIDT